jgi:hypothetical protein
MNPINSTLVLKSGIHQYELGRSIFISLYDMYEYIHIFCSGLRSCLVKKCPSEKFLNRLDFFAASRRIVALFNEEQRKNTTISMALQRTFSTKQLLITLFASKAKVLTLRMENKKDGLLHRLFYFQEIVGIYRVSRSIT